MKFVPWEFHVKLSREWHVKLVSREIHLKYLTWIAGETSFTWNSRESSTFISREFCEQKFIQEFQFQVKKVKMKKIAHLWIDISHKEQHLIVKYVWQL